MPRLSSQGREPSCRPAAYSVVQYPPCRCRLSLPQRSLITTSSRAGDSLNSQASSASLFQSLEGMIPFAVAEDEVAGA
jgi:hypothetical protein